jgi:hypothetical protein
MAGTFIKDIVGGLGSKLLGIVTPLFAATGPIMGLLSNPATWAVVAAGLFGAAFGTAINKWIIEPIRNHFWNKWDESNKKAAASENKAMDEAVKRARGKTATGMEAYYGRVEASALGSMAIKQRQEALGTDSRFMEVQKGQMEFVRKNLAEYSKYDPNLLKSYRAQWLEGEGKWIGSRWFWSDPVAYGSRREQAFFQWLQRTAPEVDPNKMLAAHEAQIYASRGVAGDADYMVRKYGQKAKDWVYEKGKYAVTVGGQIVDKATGKILDAKDLAEMKSTEVLAAAKVVQRELKARGLEGVEGMKDLGDKFGGHLNQATTVINQQMSNATRVFNSGKDRAGDMYDEMKQRVVTGNFH